MKVDQDSFEEWLAHPLTEALFRICDAGIAQSQEQWTELSWRGGTSDALKLAQLRARAAAFEEVKKLSKDDFEELA